MWFQDVEKRVCDGVLWIKGGLEKSISIYRKLIIINM